MNKLVGISTTVAIMTAVLFYLSIGSVVDAIDGALAAGLAGGTLPPLGAISYIITLYQVVLAGTFALATSLAIQSRTGVELGVASILLGWILVLLLAIASMLFVDGFVLSLQSTAWIIPLFVAFVLRSPGTFLVLQSACFIVSLMIIARGKLK